jgi:general secretion pathway protein N
LSKALPVIIALLLAVILAVQWALWSPEIGAVATDTAQSQANAPAAEAPIGGDLLTRLAAAESKDSYASIIERPLFRPDRKPEPPPEALPKQESAAERQALDTIDLTAVLISPSAVSAWVTDPGKPRPQRLRIGDEFKGWAVREILEDRVVLERQGERNALVLRDYSKMPPPAASPPGSSPAAQRRQPRPPRPTPPPQP